MYPLRIIEISSEIIFVETSVHECLAENCVQMNGNEKKRSN